MTTAVIHFTAGHEVVMSTAFFSQIFFFDYDFVSKALHSIPAYKQPYSIHYAMWLFAPTVHCFELPLLHLERQPLRLFMGE
jgi:hypothetical protein